jgi:hypothetical protein
MGRRGSTRTRTTQSTVRYMSEPIRLCTDLHSSDHQPASKPPNHRLLIGPHQQRARRVGVSKHPNVQEPQQDIRAWQMDVGRLRVSTRDVEHCAFQKACQWTAHRRPENIQLLGVQGESHTALKAQQISLGIITGWAYPRVSGGAGVGLKFPPATQPAPAAWVGGYPCRFEISPPFASFFDNVPSTIDSTATTHGLTERRCKSPL